MAAYVIGLFLAVTVAGGASGARERRWANGASSSAGSFASSSAGGMAGYAGGGFVFPPYQPQPFLTPQDVWLQYQQQFQNAFHNNVNPGYGTADGGLNTRILGPNGVSTSASAVIGPNGGYGSLNGVGFRLGGDYDDGQTYGGDDLMTRGGPVVSASFAGPGNAAGPGGSFSSFSSSSSSQQTVDGKTKTQQQSAFGVNDNGRITFKTFKSP